MSRKASPGHFRLLYFASAAAFTRKSSDDFPAPLPIKDLFGLVERKYPGMTSSILSSCAVTLNLEYIDIEDDQNTSIAGTTSPVLINEGDEVAIIPPVSSG